MLNWLRGKRKAEPLPHYSGPRALPSPDLPDESEAVAARRGEIERELLERTRRAGGGAPLLTEVLVGDQGVLTIPGSDGGQCLLAFGTQFRAADYARTLLAPGPRAEYLSSSPLHFVRLLGDLRE